MNDPVQTLRARHVAQGLRLHSRTACPYWLGERLDLGWAIDVLHPRANPLSGGLGAGSSGASGPAGRNDLDPNLDP